MPLQLTDSGPGEVQLIAAPRQLHQLVAQIMVIIRRAVDGLRDALAAVIVGIRPRLPRRLIVLADYSLTFKSSRFVGLDSF